MPLHEGHSCFRFKHTRMSCPNVSMKAGQDPVGLNDPFAKPYIQSLIGYITKLATVHALAGVEYEGRDTILASDIVRGYKMVVLDGETLRQCTEVFTAFLERRPVDFETYGLTQDQVQDMLEDVNKSREELLEGIFEQFNFTPVEGNDVDASTVQRSIPLNESTHNVVTQRTIQKTDSRHVESSVHGGLVQGESEAAENKRDRQDQDQDDQNDQEDQRKRREDTLEEHEDFDEEAEEDEENEAVYVYDETMYQQWKNIDDAWQSFEPQTILEVFVHHTIQKLQTTSA